MAGDSELERKYSWEGRLGMRRFREWGLRKKAQNGTAWGLKLDVETPVRGGADGCGEKK
jgi:hypothetical protein